MTEQRTDFSDLIRGRRAELGVSLRTLAARCVDPETGEEPGHAWISKVEHGKPVDTPRPATLRALHVGLQLPLRTVKEAAAAQFLDLDVVWSADHTTRAIVNRLSDLTAEERAQIAAITETFARRRTQGNHLQGDDPDE